LPEYTGPWGLRGHLRRAEWQVWIREILRREQQGENREELLAKARQAEKDGKLRECVRKVAFVLLHHDNRAGTISGRFEPVVDTLIHVASANRKTTLSIEKARNASKWHGKTYDLAWESGEAFAVEAKETGEAEVWQRIAQAVHDQPGSSWASIKKLVSGVGDEIKTKVRDDHLATGDLVNLVNGNPTYDCPPRIASHLYLPSDLATAGGGLGGGEAGAGSGALPLKGEPRPLQPKPTAPTDGSLTGVTEQMQAAEVQRPGAKLDHTMDCAERLSYPSRPGKLTVTGKSSPGGPADWLQWKTRARTDLANPLTIGDALIEVDGVCEWLEAGTRGEWRAEESSAD
jgi:hypothetical protein